MAAGERNVLGGQLQACGTDPLTGFYRDGYCTTGPEDRGSHTIWWPPLLVWRGA